MKTILILCYVVISSLLLYARGAEVEPNDSCASFNCETATLKWAVKTNMLYDAALVPNIGVELAFADNYSVSANWMYAWWSKNAKHRFYRIYGGEVEARRWLGNRSKPQLTGHHVGIYYQMVTYDFEFGGKGSMSDTWNYSVGLSYGYSLPINNHLNIDFAIGLGYMWGRYKKYHPQDGCYVWDSTNKRKWFGPTKGEITLVYIIGGKCSKKGGNR